FVEQTAVGLRRAADSSLQPLGFRVELADDLVVPIRAIDDDEALEQLGAIFVERSDFDRAAGPPTRGEKTVAIRRRARDDFLHAGTRGARVAGNRERDDAAAIEEENPADGASEEKLAAAVLEPRVPVHQFGERQSPQDAGENVREHIDRRLAAL